MLSRVGTSGDGQPAIGAGRGGCRRGYDIHSSQAQDCMAGGGSDDFRIRAENFEVDGQASVGRDAHATAGRDAGATGMLGLQAWRRYLLAGVTC